MNRRQRRWTAPDHLANDPRLAVLSPPPLSAPARVRAEFALHYAVLAPSIHNSQPWRIRVCDEVPGSGAFEVYADLARDLPGSDPEHRQLILSCGAAIGALHSGLSSLGLRAEVELTPDPTRPRLLARINTSDLTINERPVLDSYGLLARYLSRRRTFRGELSSEQPERDHLLALTKVATLEGAELIWVLDDERKRQIAQLVAQSDREQESVVFGELQLWSSRDQRVKDGVPPENWQVSSSAAARDPLSQRDFAQGRPVPPPSDSPSATEPSDPHRNVPAVAVVSTTGDRMVDWLQAGQALMHVLLEAEARGLAVGYLNQPLESPSFRLAIAQTLRESPHKRNVIPQVALKLGYPRATMPPAAPRRTAVTVLERP
jgi:nitroreductase